MSTVNASPEFGFPPGCLPHFKPCATVAFQISAFSVSALRCLLSVVPLFSAFERDFQLLEGACELGRFKAALRFIGEDLQRLVEVFR